jgi:hypothetical protein
MPDDRTPAGDEMDETRPTPKFPETEPGPRARDVEREPDIANRPPLPDHPPAMNDADLGREQEQRERAAERAGLDTTGGA